MDRLKAFWAKSWINKIIAVAGVFVLACCALTLIIGSLAPRRAAAVPTAVAQQAAAAQPVEQPTGRPEPTVPPKPTEAPRGYVSRDTLGAPWPLEVDDGTIICSGAAILLRTNRGLFAVNGTARGQLPKPNWHDIREITLPDPNNAGLIMSVQPIINRGLDICK